MPLQACLHACTVGRSGRKRNAGPPPPSVQDAGGYKNEYNQATYRVREVEDSCEKHLTIQFLRSLFC